ncbi:MAG: lytA 4, partial [Oscillospiraceae bacterium]|nr:lytA 4 [Oscillospiraceae bacterium]
LAEKAGTITGTSVAVKVPYATDLTNLVPVVTVSPKAIYDVSGKDFTNAVTVTVTAEDGTTTKTYTVTVTKEAPQPPTKIVLNKITLALDVTKSETLKATVTGEDQTVTWTSILPEFATVDSNGKVTAKATGMTVIYATTSDEEIYATCIVYVKGWYSDGGQRGYITDKGFATDWFKVDGKYYYGEPNQNSENYGAVYTNKWIKDGSKWYYVDGSGVMVTNKWIKSSGKWHYVDGSGAMVTSKWIKSSGKYYYVDGSGIMATNKWLKSGSKYYYVDGSGIMATNKWIKSGSKYYYVDKSGVMLTSKWIKSSGKWYYVDAKGVMLANTSKKIGKKTYKFNKTGVCTNP